MALALFTIGVPMLTVLAFWMHAYITIPAKEDK